jgi:hypothetical protein
VIYTAPTHCTAFGIYHIESVNMMTQYLPSCNDYV